MEKQSATAARDKEIEAEIAAIRRGIQGSEASLIAQHGENKRVRDRQASS